MKKVINECIEFDELRQTYTHLDAVSFDKYIEDIFNELSVKKNNKMGITKNRFLDFLTGVPILVSEKIFNSFDTKSQGFLGEEDFCTPIKVLQYGTFEQVAEFTFKVYDFDKDGNVSIPDIRLLLSFLPLNDISKKEYKFQMESLDELEDIIAKTFEKKTVNLAEYMEALEKKANVFLLLYCYILITVPVFDMKLSIYKKTATSKMSSKGSTESDYFQKLMSDSPKINYGSGGSNNSPKTPGVSKRLNMQKSPSCFSPIVQLREKKMNTPSMTPITSSLRNNGAVRIKNSMSILSNPGGSVTTETPTSTPGVKKNIAATSFLKQQRNNLEDMPSNFANTNKDPKIAFNSDIVECDEEAAEDNMTKQFASHMIIDEKEIQEELEKSVSFEGQLSRISNSESSRQIETFNLSLIETSIYYYKNPEDNKENYYKSHYLCGCFIRENQGEQINSDVYYSFTILFAEGKRKQYYHKDSKVIIAWIKALRKALNYKNFFDYYKMGSNIGEGQFGVIKQGSHILSKQAVAIKILKKEDIKTKEDWDLIKTEIDIMKISKHPNIIKFLDHFENSDYIFIVMEYLKSGNLQGYLEKIKFKITEKQAANISYQLADALKYLHKFGIVHRDLKPDNIMLAEDVKGDDVSIKLMDFGLSKILGNKEKTNEGYGTLAFVAPEIIIRQPYNNSVDIWSLGIITHYMLTGTLPFMAENNDVDEMALLICQKELVFSTKFKEKSPDVMDFIKICLIKQVEKRASIEKLLVHPWFKTMLKK